MNRITRLAPTAVLAAIAAATLAGPVAPASADVAIPVNCTDGATITGDDLTYELHGPCGVVKILASNTTVDMPASTKLIVRGDHNTVTARPIQRVRVLGRAQDLHIASAKRARIASPGSRVHFGGLVEHITVQGNRAHLSARQITNLLVSGNRNTVSTRRGYDARVGGDHNAVSWKWLDHLVVAGDDNRLDVRRGSTDTTVTGAGNHLDLNHPV